MTREELEARILTHHEESFGWALHCARFDRTEAEDVVQSAYLKVLQGHARFDGRSAFRTWLFGVIRRTALERWRWRTLRAAFLDRWRSSEANEDDPLARLAADGEARLLIAALERLSERQRDVLHLVFYQDMSVAEAAATLGLRLGTARTHYERGKARLRELLDVRETP